MLHNDESTLMDALDRERLRKEFGQAIASCNPPHVFGLHGEWGSGKTSFLRQLRFELDQIEDAEQGHSLQSTRFGKQIATVWFEAWRYQSEPLPIVALLQEIRRQLGKRNTIKTAAHEALKLAEISAQSILNGFDDVAKLLKLEGISTKGIQATGETWEKEHLQTRLGTDSIRDFLEQAVNGLLNLKVESGDLGTARVVVFIDDLDRCQAATAFKLLEALKIHLSLPNCVFVLGMNQQTVVEAIASEFKRDEMDAGTRLKAEAYLEKLCTNIWRLPLPQDGQRFFLSLLSSPELKTELTFGMQDCRCLPPNPRRLKALANVVNRLWDGLSEADRQVKQTAYATLVYAYIYQFHGELFRRWQWDGDYLKRIAQFARNPQPQNDSDKTSGFAGLILPTHHVDEGSGPQSAFPDPSIAGVFWIAPLIQKGGPFEDARPEDFMPLLNIGL